MGTVASEFKAKVNNSHVPEKYLKARESLWEYNKLINPKFFRESRPHLKIIADTLQAVYEHRIIKHQGSDSWQIVTKEEKVKLDEGQAEYTACRNLAIDIPPRHGKSYNLSQFCDWVFGKDQEQRVIAITYN